MKVRCVNDMGTHITEGKIYDVITEDYGFYKMYDDDGQIYEYHSERFEIVDENCPKCGQKLEY